MNPIKRLAGQTAIYGLPSIIGRILGYLLVPLYTRVFTQAEYGIVNLFYAYTALLLVILPTAWRLPFSVCGKGNRQKPGFQHRISFPGASTSFPSAGPAIFQVRSHIGSNIPTIRHYIIWFALIIGFDVLSSIPFAKLRSLNRPTPVCLDQDGQHRPQHLSQSLLYSALSMADEAIPAVDSTTISCGSSTIPDGASNTSSSPTSLPASLH